MTRVCSDRRLPSGDSVSCGSWDSNCRRFVRDGIIPNADAARLDPACEGVPRRNESAEMIEAECSVSDERNKYFSRSQGHSHFQT